MVDQNSADDLFRFVQLRPRRTLDDTQPIPLDDSTSFARALGKSTSVAERAKLAEGVLPKLVPTLGQDAVLGRQVLDAGSRLASDPAATTADLVREVPAVRQLPDGEDGRIRTRALSDVLLASYFASRGIPAELDVFQTAYRMRFLPADGTPPAVLSAFLRRPLLTALVRTDPAPRRASLDAGPPLSAARDAVGSAVQELMLLDQPGLLETPSVRGTLRRGSTAFALSDAGLARLSPASVEVLAAHGVDARSEPLDSVVMQLLRAKTSLPVGPIHWPFPTTPPEPGATLPPAPGPAVVSPAGVADLLVVKQQLKRYEGAEVAHVENVLIGEKKARSHRQLDRTEDTFLTETEVTGVKESELQTTDRFELNRETSQTIKSDVKSGFDLSVSGKYGPTVDFKASTSLSATTSNEQSAKNSTRFAKDIVARSLERVTTRVREQRTTTIIRETEETNLHELTNGTPQHINGVYQFLDKIYESQVFNYGIREMFDFMIPEPASFLWFVAQNPNTDLVLPPEPRDLRLVCPDASALTEDLALALAAEYGADIDPPPVPYQLLAASFKHGDDNASEENQPRSNQQADVTVPAGYQVVRARFHGTAVTDENPVVAVTIGSATPRIWRGGTAVSVSAGNRIIHTPQLAIPLDAEPHPLSGDNKLNVLLIAYETNTYAFEVVVVARRTEALMDAWRLVTFGKLLAKYEDRLREYQQKVEQIKADAQAKAERDNALPFGTPPAMNQATIAAELKKHCISVLTQQWYDAFDATKDGTPPTFDLADAAAEGAYIRFFEQSFEWDQAQWVFYPYFWARKNTWVDRFLKQDADPQFQDFLRAGSARVVVPVRPGFEVAITHFLETGKLWGGEGEPPQINNPMYVSIVDEIRERTGAPRGEIPVGDPWETRVPTALVLVRPNSDLPTWRRVSPDDWDWITEEP